MQKLYEEMYIKFYKSFVKQPQDPLSWFRNVAEINGIGSSFNKKKFNALYGLFT